MQDRALATSPKASELGLGAGKQGHTPGTGQWKNREIMHARKHGELMFSFLKSQGKHPQTPNKLLYRTYIQLCKIGNLLWTSEFLVQVISMRPKKQFHFSEEAYWWEIYLMCISVSWKAGFSSKGRSSSNKVNLNKFSNPQDILVKSIFAIQRRLNFDLCNADH